MVPEAVPRRNTPSFNALRHVHSPSREILITRFPFARDSKRFDSWSNRRERGREREFDPFFVGRRGIRGHELGELEGVVGSRLEGKVWV